MRATLLGLFAGLAMALAAIGVYGVVAYLVGQRTQEIGVRRALGAQATEIVGMLVRESMRPVMTGIAVGLLGAFALSRVLSAMLFQVSSTDVATYAMACGGLAIAALLASVIPARRALRRRSDQRCARPVRPRPRISRISRIRAPGADDRRASSAAAHFNPCNPCNPWMILRTRPARSCGR